MNLCLLVLLGIIAPGLGTAFLSRNLLQSPLPHGFATITGCSVKAVERRLSHAREQPRKLLSRYVA